MSLSFSRIGESTKTGESQNYIVKLLLYPGSSIPQLLHSKSISWQTKPKCKAQQDYKCLCVGNLPGHLHIAKVQG